MHVTVLFPPQDRDWSLPAGVPLTALGAERVAREAAQKAFGESARFIELKKLYVSHDYRGQGVGVQLFDAAKSVARTRGASFLYISATPTENTVNFYRNRGSILAVPPDPERLTLEPDDIHLVMRVGDPWL